MHLRDPNWANKDLSANQEWPAYCSRTPGNISHGYFKLITLSPSPLFWHNFLFSIFFWGGAYFGDLEINYSRLFDSYFRKMDRTDIVKRERVKLIENGDCVSVPRKYFRDSYANSLKPSVSKPFGTVNVFMPSDFRQTSPHCKIKNGSLRKLQLKKTFSSLFW